MHLTMTLKGIARRRSGHSLRIWSTGVVASDERIGNKSLISPIKKGNWKTGKNHLCHFSNLQKIIEFSI